MNENLKIDELLNAYVDGELSPRQETEVQRLLDHDEDIVRRLNEIKSVRHLVKNLPSENPPENILEDIKSKLERHTLLEERPQQKTEIIGKFSLFARKIVSYAAVLVMISGLVFVIYQIVSPDLSENTDIAAKNTDSVEIAKENVKPELNNLTYKPENPEIDNQEIPAKLAQGFSGELSLYCKNTESLNSALKQIIKNHNLNASLRPDYENQKNIFSINLSYRKFNSLIEELSNHWKGISYSELKFSSENEDHLVGGVKPGQILEIAGMSDIQKQKKAARYFAKLNEMTSYEERIPDRSPEEVNTSTVPKPILAGGKSPERSVDSDRSETEKEVEIKIIVMPENK